MRLAFVDLETTGGSPVEDRITEVGIIEVDLADLDAHGAPRPIREWSALVNPDAPIPPFIETLTGITNAMVADAPRFEELADDILTRLDGRLFIAHNARFDHGFLKNAFRRLDRPFRPPVLCTVRLSRKLYPGYARHNLDTLIERHRLVVDMRHRALGDARLLWQLWQRLHDALPADQISAAIDQLTARPSLPRHLDPDVLDTLPKSAGVYLFLRDPFDEVPVHAGVDTAANDAGRAEVQNDAVGDAAVLDAVPIDAAAIDAPSMDAAFLDAAFLDAAVFDAAVFDAVVLDAITVDAHVVDASVVDASVVDASGVDASRVDASGVDAPTGSTADPVHRPGGPVARSDDRHRDHGGPVDVRHAPRPDAAAGPHRLVEEPRPLYIGKAKNLRQRVMAHFTGDHLSAREMEISQQMTRIEWIETGGGTQHDLGALLTEATLVKERLPAYNRQLRKNEDVCAWRLVVARGPVRAGRSPWKLALARPDDLFFAQDRDLYGPFATPRQAGVALRAIVDAHGLCPALLKLEKAHPGKPCFSHQVKRCRGACVGLETVAEHTARLQDALASMAVVPWPFGGPIAFREGTTWHVVDGWAYLGMASGFDAARRRAASTRPFDHDVYRLLARRIDAMEVVRL